jgi:hypothetical protein
MTAPMVVRAAAPLIGNALRLVKPRRIEVPAQSGLDLLPREFREMVVEAERRCWAASLPVLRFETARTLARCQFLYGKGRTAEQLRAKGVPEMYAWPDCPDGIVTNATSNAKSWHGAYLAVDWIHPKLRWSAPRTWWRSVAAIIKPVGFTWGGDWVNLPDAPHYQHRALPSGPRLVDQQDIAATRQASIYLRYSINAA